MLSGFAHIYDVHNVHGAASLYYVDLSHGYDEHDLWESELFPYARYKEDYLFCDPLEMGSVGWKTGCVLWMFCTFSYCSCRVLQLCDN